MEKLKSKEIKSIKPSKLLDSEVPSAPTMDDFYIDPGIEDTASIPNVKVTGTDGQSEKALAPALADPLGVTSYTEDILSDQRVAGDQVSHSDDRYEANAPPEESYKAAAPPLEDQVSSVVTPVLLHNNLTSTLQHMSPHHAVQQDLQFMSPHQVLQQRISNKQQLHFSVIQLKGNCS